MLYLYKRIMEPVAESSSDRRDVRPGGNCLGILGADERDTRRNSLVRCSETHTFRNNIFSPKNYFNGNHPHE